MLDPAQMVAMENLDLDLAAKRGARSLPNLILLLSPCEFDGEFS
jgi:hypothetical protein